MLYESTLESANDLYKWSSGAVNTAMGWLSPESSLYVDTLEGRHEAKPGDYIIKGIKGEFYPCKPDIFLKSYDILVAEAESTLVGKARTVQVAAPDESWMNKTETVKKGNSIQL